jgi:hypothetical protein
VRRREVRGRARHVTAQHERATGFEPVGLGSIGKRFHENRDLDM